MISIICGCLLLLAYCQREQTYPTRAQLRAWKRERLDLNPALRRRA